MLVRCVRLLFFLNRKMKLPMWNHTLQKKTCQPALLGRVWHAFRRALRLEHSPCHEFACSQWQKGTRPSTAYLVYRWVLFLSVVCIGVSSFACQRLPRNYEGPKVELNYFKWFIYFTNWGFIVIGVQALLAVFVAHRYKAAKSFNIACEDDEGLTSRRPRTPLLCRVYWLAHIVATDLAFVITVIYWTLVHNPEIHELNTLNLLVHGGNSLVMLLELAVTSHPIRAAHALYGASVGVIYGVFSALYWAMGGTDRIGQTAIYPSLNWNQPGPAFGFVALCAVVMIVAHCLATVLVMLRLRIAAKLRPSRLSDRYSLPTH